MLIFLSVIDGETDRSAFERLYDQYADGIFRKTLSILKNQTDAEDVVQEAWTILYLANMEFLTLDVCVRFVSGRN